MQYIQWERQHILRIEMDKKQIRSNLSNKSPAAGAAYLCTNIGILNANTVNWATTSIQALDYINAYSTSSTLLLPSSKEKFDCCPRCEAAIVSQLLLEYSITVRQLSQITSVGF